MTFKSIKELENNIYDAQSCDEQDTYMYEENKKREIEILEDVLKLIEGIITKYNLYWKQHLRTNFIENNVGLSSAFKELIEGIKGK